MAIPPLRVVFLDIDGVIAIRPAWKPYMPQGKPARTIRPSAVACLNRLCLLTGAQLVISSNWRKRGDIRDIVTGWGVKAGFHPAWRTDADGPSRGAEVSRWVDMHCPSSYVILDDTLSGFAGVHDGRFVWVDWRIGLHARAVDKAALILAPDLGPAADIV